MGIRDVGLALKYQRLSDEALESKAESIRLKYHISDADWKELMVNLATKTSREVVGQLGGKLKGGRF